MDYKTAHTHDILVCDDCVLMMANGEIDGDEAREDEVARALAAAWGPGSISLGRIAGHDESRHEFRSSPCDGCGSRLAGSREPATGWTDAA